MYTLPSPRYSFFEQSSFERIRTPIQKEMNAVTEALSFYPMEA